MTQPDFSTSRPTSAVPASWPGSPTSEPPESAPDPGSPGARLIAFLLCLLLIPTVVVLNQWEAMAPPATPPSAFHIDRMDPISLIGKMAVKLEHMGKSMGAPSTNTPVWLSQLDSNSPAPTDKLRVAIAAGELAGPDQAVERLNALEASLNDGAAAQPTSAAAPAPTPLTDEEKATLASDVDVLQRHYTAAPPPLTDDERKGLVERYGWFGKLALSHGLADTDPARAPLLAGGGKLMTTLVFAGIVFALWILGGIGAFITILVMISSGRIKRRFVPPAPGGSVYLETLAVFVLSFLLLQFIPTIIAKVTGAQPTETLALGLQWVLVLVPLWPLFRGVSFSRHRRLVGWHSGRGFFREVGCGILAYFAGLPLLAVAFLITLVILFTYQAIRSGMGLPPEQPKNAIVDILMGGDALVLVLLFLLASVWAPFVEESVFRGGLYRHLRARFAVPLSAIASAFVFGVMHGYQIFMLLPVITLGFTFAMMREWRGSLIAPMTAHALHNGTLLLIVISLLSSLG